MIVREIKFRAWLKDEKRMAKVHEVSFFDDKVFTIATIDNFYADDEFKLMQSTGLKDNNGVEIYEGDIVKHKYMCDGIFYTEAVIYDKNYASFGLKANSGTIFYFVELNDDALSSLEVIGNIYENPELLGGK